MDRLKLKLGRTFKLCLILSNIIELVTQLLIFSTFAGHYGGQEQQYSGGASSSDGVLSNCRGNKKALLIGINYFGQVGVKYFSPWNYLKSD